MNLSEDPTQDKAAVLEYILFMQAEGSIMYVAVVTRLVQTTCALVHAWRGSLQAGHILLLGRTGCI